MKKQVLLLITMLLYMSTKAQNPDPNVGFTAYNTGTQFVSVEVDEASERVWAAARYVNSNNSIFKMEEGETTFTTFQGITPTGTPLKNYFIRDLAIDFEGNVWVAHYGHGNNNVVGGVEKIRPDLSIKHYYAEDAGGGLLTRKVRSIIVDKNDKVWAAQYHHRLIQTPPGAGANTTTIYPGTLAWKSEFDFDFNVLGNRYRCSAQPTELPYPRNTFGEIVVPSTAERNFQALSSDDTEVWASHWAYETNDDDCSATHENFPARILRYNLNGTYQGSFSAGDMGFAVTNASPAGDLITNICRNNELGTWVTTSENNDGFSVYKNDTWIHISPADFPIVIPPNTGFNANAMWKDENGKVYMGTNNGLIVYKGTGPVDVESSYKIYTNYDYGADPTSDNYDSYVYDDTMSSRNIFGGCTDPRDPRINWIATENGIMKMGVREGVELWHINNYMGYAEYENSPEEERYNSANSMYVGNIKNITGVPENEVVTVTADGTKSSFLKIYTDDPQGYYDGNYTLTAGNGLDDEEDEYGKFTIKTPESHEDYDFSLTESANIAQFKYIEYTYQHPKYVDFAQCEDGKIYRLLNFKIINQNGDEIFNAPFKLSRTPILLAHGVWSSVKSLKELETYFLSHGYPESMLIKVWKDFETAEKAYEDVSWIIPSKIDELKEKCAKDKISVGKVNVVAHSRGGLYTRAYIEDIHESFMGSYTKRKDVNSLITLDTPHFGSQGANIVLDKRIVTTRNLELFNTAGYLSDIATTLSFPDDIEDYIFDFSTLGDIATLASVPKNDRQYNWGARNLLVSDDNISGITTPEDPEFIKKLNRDDYHSKLVEAQVSIHTFSAEFDACQIDPVFCNPALNLAITKIPHKIAKRLLLVALNGVPQSINSITSELFNGEPNDFIVPKSSMTGGLTGTQNTNYESDNGNYDHTGMFGHGIAKSDAVLSDIFVLLTRNVNDEMYFSKSGLIRTVKPTYNFLATILDPALQRRNVSTFTSKILINRDPAIFDNRVEGDVLNFNVYQEDVDRIMLTYESENDKDNIDVEIKSDNLSFENPFTYTIPEGYGGELTITAYGYKNGVVGVAKNTVTLNVGIPADVTLESIHFTTEEPVILEQDSYNYTIKGVYSDGIERIINNSDITFTIEEASVLSQVDANAVKGETVGASLLKAAFSGFEDTVKVKVRSNPSLQQTILTNLYAVPNDDNSEIVVNWITLHEYENATFVLETSYDTPDNFTEINSQAGNGTLDTSAQFNYTDTSFGAHTHIYYRIKMIDTQGNETYSSIIEVNLSTASVHSNNYANVALSLYPNPTNTGDVTLKLNSNIADNNAKLEMYSLRGKRLSRQAINVQSGENSFNLKVGSNLVSGIYFVKISTKAYVKTVKLIVE